MRIEVAGRNGLINIRENYGKLWYPKKDKAVIDKMDTLFERTKPTELMWDKSKPKVENIKEIVNPREITEPKVEEVPEPIPLTFEDNE
jgi:hypothetical protein